MKHIKIAIDSKTLSSQDKIRGIGVHSSELIANLLKCKDEEMIIDPVNTDEIKVSSYDLVHLQSFNPFVRKIPLTKKGKKMLLTVHDLIYLNFPKYYPPGIKGKVVFELQKLLLRNFDAIFTISEKSKRDIQKFLPFKKKIYVIYLAPKEIFKKIDDLKYLSKIREKYSLPEKFVLYNGDVNYNKNLITLARAVKKAGLKLVMVGKNLINEDIDFNHPENKPFAQFLKEFGKDKDITRIGFIKDKDLVAIYNLADIYSQASYDEGFGFSNIHAMAVGTPVVASDIACHREILGDASMFADPKSVEDFSRKLTIMSENNEMREKYIRLGFNQVKKYSWVKTANETISAYKQILGIY